jgi:ATP-dependent exoDNAse (exonuclease V) beta subunit
LESDSPTKCKDSVLNKLKINASENRFVIPANLFYFGRMGLIIYKSSAGSGKTFTLVNIFLKKVLEKPWLFRRILAITFTNKATEELKTRIIRELDILASGGKSPHLPTLVQSLPKLDETTIRQNAKLVLTRILHDYSSFHISTIDSFFQSLSRVLAREMLLPMKYEIELDTEAICRDVTELLLDEAGKNKTITEWLEELLYDRIENGKSWNINAELKKMTRQLLISHEARNWAGRVDASALMSFIQWMLATKKETEQTMRNIGKLVEEELKKYQLTADRFYYKKNGPVGYFLKIARKRSSDDEFNSINGHVEKALEDPLAFLSKENRNDQALVQFCSNFLHPKLKEAINFYSSVRNKYLTISEALKLIYQSGIISELEEKLKIYREKHQLFHLSDTTRMLSKAIEDQDAPFIYEKSGNTFIHILIDEFQDTSEEQWSILKPLIINTLGSGNDIYIVGDAKQSIYRWRGGEMELIVDGVRKDLGKNGFKPEEKILDTNWRSRREIIEFNNSFFPIAGQLLAEGFPDIHQKSFNAYTPEAVRQNHPNTKDEAGYIDIRFFATEKPTTETEDKNNLNWKDKALNQMKTEIAALLESGYSFRDIVILVRTNQHESTIADYIRNSTTYPVLSSNSLLLAVNEKIQFILNCLRLLINQDQPLLHAEVCYFIDRTQTNNEIPFHRSSYQSAKNSWSQQYIESRKNELMHLPLHFVFLYLIDAGNISKCDPYIQKLNDLIDEYTNGHGNNISGFISWWDEHVDTRKWSVELPDAGNAIRIITIHKSKGLEFPVVFIPFLDWSIVPRSTSLLWANADNELFAPLGKLPVYTVKGLNETWFSKDYRKELYDSALDNLNLLYVAFTRPEAKLFVYGPEKPKENDVGRLLQQILLNHENFAHKMRDGFCYISGENQPAKEKSVTQASGNIYNPQSFIPEDIPGNPERIFLPSLRITYQSPEIIIGNLVHEVLEIVHHRTFITSAVDRILRRENNRAYYSMKEVIQSKVNDIWELMEKNKWTSDFFKVLSEIEICDEHQRIHRPDKVLVNDEQTVVIDFKTGKQETSHKQQVADYCRLLEVTGLKSISGYLIYTSEKEAVKIDWPVLNVTGQTQLFD